MDTTAISLDAFRHEALLYAGVDELIAGTVPFIREGLDAGEPVMVALGAAKLDKLREALGDDRESVHLADMEQIGRNPATIIPAWRSFLAERRPDGGAIRGIGEPIWSGRTHEELVECQLHEALLNVAFAESRGFQLLCPYDESSLDPAVIHEARCSHPYLHHAPHESSRDYRGLEQVAAPFDGPLPVPARRPEVMSFTAGTLADVRELVGRRAVDAGLDPLRATDLVLAVHELATNSVRHGGGNGLLRVWREDDVLLCEVKDRGHIRDPLAGRHVTEAEQLGGRGLWLVNRLCDLVQIRSAPTGTTVRVHMGGLLPEV